MKAMSLREHRRGRKWTQERLAAESGVDQTTISRLETEPNPNPTETTKNALAKALGIAPSKLRFTTPSSDAIGTRGADREGHDVPDTRTA
jgi:transcriptional regulator with XRE-family HTH domain